MARLFIVDHSLKNEGGHHFDYSLLIANTSIAKGHETIVGTHRNFRTPERFPHSCQVRNVFRNSTYSSLAHFRKILDITESLQSTAPQSVTAPSSTKHSSSARQGPIVEEISHGGATARLHSRLLAATGEKKQTKWKLRLLERQRERESQRFSRDLQKFFSEFRFQASDHVFLHTVSEIDLKGVAGYLQQNRESNLATWHLQFHFNLFVGRTPEYEFQYEFVRETQESILESIELMAGHHVNLYANSETLLRQFAAIGVTNISTLPYPVNPELRTRTNKTSSDDDRLQVTCAGGIRPEKGQSMFGDLLQSLWDPFLKDQRIKLVIQRKKRTGFRQQQVEVSPAHGKADPELIESAIDWAKHPLPRDGYADLIRNTDIGLLIYDSRAYFSRRAGILGEYLAAGIPVIVPAGNWMSDQIAEANFRYAQQLVIDARQKANHRSEIAAWTHNAAANLGQIVVGDRPELQPRCVVPTDGKSSGLVLEFNFIEPTAQGYFLKIEVLKHDRFGNELERHNEIVGVRGHQSANTVFILTSTDIHDVELRLSNAYEDSLLLLSDITVHHLTDTDASARRRPLGTVGLAAADLNQIPRLLTDLVQNYTHYRASAERFSGEWFDAHNPAETVQHLFRSEAYRRAVA